MNGVHDMGGMHGLGPIRREQDEPVFHEQWEARAHAMHSAMGAWRRWDTDSFRFQVESMHALEYLRMSYYERRFAALTKLVILSGLVSAKELEEGHPAVGTAKQSPALDTAGVERMFSVNGGMNRPAPAPALYRAGDAVRTRNINPVHHTRLPRYARGKTGVIERLHGAWVFPDTNAQGLGREAQHLYTVRFTARELWGETANPRDTVRVDLWDDYLEAA
jgi:nitrile hydratase subunit beta